MAHAIGKIVRYTVTEDDANAVNRRRGGTQRHLHEHRANDNGVQVHVGNAVEEGQVFPMMIVRTWGESDTSSVNGQVFLDGNDTLWVTSVEEGDGPRKFKYPERV